jgi:TonB family protein
VHYLTRRLISKLPLWMVEGLAEFYANVRIDSKTVFIGAPSTSNLYVLRDNRMLPVEQLIAIDSSSSYYNERNKTSIFYAESWALVHYLYERDWNENTDRVTRFMGLMAQGADQFAAAAKTIGDPKALNEPLQNYIRRTSFTAAKFDAPRIDEDKFQIRPMSDAEAAAVRADFMARDQHQEAAQQMIEDAIKADPKLALAYETLAFIALQKGNMQDAEKWAAQSIELNPNAGRANFYYASSLLRNGAPDEPTRLRAEKSLRAAIQSNPDFTPAYDALAYTLLLSEAPEKADEAYRFILEAIQREPGNIQYRIRAVAVQERRDHPADAVRAAQMTVSVASTPQDRAAAEQALLEAQRYQQWWDQAHAPGNAGTTVPTASPGSPPTVTASPSAPMRGLRQVRASAMVEVLSNTGGADLSSYLEKEVLPKVQHAWSLEMLKTHSTTAPSSGTVIVEFSIGQDGTVSGITMKKSTEQAILDDTTRAAIAASSPFPVLPSNYAGKTLALRLQCDYSTDETQTENGDPQTKKK